MEVVRASIYAIENTTNGKIYIGKSVNPNNRWKHHLKVARGGIGKYPHDFSSIHGAIHKYGEAKFKFIILEEFDTEEVAYLYETWWINYFGSCNRKFGYNLNHGGIGNTSPSEETRLKKSLAVRGENRPNTKLNEIKVKDILNKWMTGEFTRVGLGKLYDVKKCVIDGIINGDTWKWVSRPVGFKTTGVHNEEQRMRLNTKRGENCGGSVIKEHEAIEMIRLHRTNNYTYECLGKIYSVSPCTISGIVRGKLWKHLDHIRDEDING